MTKLKGYAGRDLWVNLSTGEMVDRDPGDDLRRRFLGGYGLGVRMIFDNQPANIDPLGPDSIFGITTGPFTGSPAPGGNRWAAVAKSPLTNMLGSANMGGFFAPELAWAGFHHLVIKGKAEKPVYLWIHNGEIEIRDAGQIWGKTTTDSQWAIREELGDEDIKSAVIGPAGENLVRFANVMTGIKNSAGRTGMGCVMGSKNLKAVAARGTMDIEIAHPVEALEYNKHFIDRSPVPR